MNQTAQQLREEARKLLGKANRIEAQEKYPWYPGPWTIRDTDTGSDMCAEIDCAFHGAFANVVVQLHEHKPAIEKRLRANAQLIAAAPELFMHLENVIKALEAVLVAEGYVLSHNDPFYDAKEFIKLLMERCK